VWILLLPTLLLAAGQPATSSELPAGGLRLYAEQTSTLRHPEVTAVYSLHPEVAGASLDERAVVITARAAGFTQIVLVFPGRTVSLAVTVEDPPLTRRARDPSRTAADEWQLGTYDVRFASDPGVVQTTLRTSRQHGTDRTELLLGGAWRLDGVGERAFTLPMTSYTRASPTFEFTLLDRVVNTSPLTVWQSSIRGIHGRHQRWTAHAGYSFFSNFEGVLLPTTREAVAGLGYEFRPDAHTRVRPQLYYFHSAAAAGSTGPLPSLVYQTERRGLRFLAEAAAAQRPALAAELDARRSGEALWVRVRLTPEELPSLTTGGGRGRMVDASWTRTANDVTVTANGSAHTYFIGARQTAVVTGARVELRVTRHLSASAGAGFSQFASPGETAIRRVSAPAGLQLRGGRLETTFDYEMSRTGAELIGHSMRGSASASWSRLRLSAFAEQQQHAPTVRQIFGAAPGVAQRLEQLAINATTTTQLAELLRTSSALSSLGYAGELAINVAPVVNRVGGSLDLAAFGDRTKLTLTTMIAREELIVGVSSAATHAISYSQQVGGSSELFLTHSVVCSDKRGGVSACRPVLGASLRHHVSRNPLGVLGRTPGGDIRGVVFRDDQARGVYAPGLPALAGVEVILDGQQRTMTDRHGRFRFRRVAGGRHAVEIRFAHQAPYFFTTPSLVDVVPNTDVNFGIGFSLGRLFGTVRNDANAPVSDVLVRVTQEEREWTARTSGDGQFALEGLPAGAYDVRIDPASVPSGYRLTDLGRISADIDPPTPGRVLLRLAAHRMISGVVRVYAPCAGAYVPVARALVTLQNGGERMTDDDGRFVFGDLPAGTQTLVATRGTLSGVAEVTLREGPEMRRGVTLSLRDTSQQEPNPPACDAR
jgi:hypothetical protein